MIDHRCCNTHCWLFVVALGLPVSTSVADEEPEIPKLTATMSWDEIHHAMESYPPSFESGDERQQIMKSLDRLICYSVKHVDEEDRPKLKPWLQQMVPFYRRRIDRCLDALESTRVEEGVHLFKLYSSSIILKSAQGTVSIDFCQGPVNNGGEPEESDRYDICCGLEE